MGAIQNDWLEVLQSEFRKPYYKQLFQTVTTEYKTRQVFPPADDIFNAFHLTPFHKVKVVILRAGSISWGWTGTWTLLFGKTGCGYSTIIG